MYHWHDRGHWKLGGFLQESQMDSLAIFISAFISTIWTSLTRVHLATRPDGRLFTELIKLTSGFSFSGIR